MSNTELYRAAFDNAAIGISLISVDPLGQYVEVNPAFCRMTGYHRSELLEKTFQSITLTEDLSKNIEQLDALLSGSSPSITIEKRYLRKNRTDFWARLNISLIHEPGGQPSFLIVQIEDIDAQKRTQAKLEASEFRYRSLVKSAGSVIVGMTRDRKIFEWNNAAERIYGWKESEILGRDYFETLLPPELHEAVAADMDKVLSGSPTENFEGRIQTRNGSWRTLLWNCVRLLNADQEPIGVISIGRDITERKDAEERLRLSQTLLNEAQQVAHIGNWNMDLSTKRITWSDELYRMFGLEPRTIPMTFDRFIAYVHPDDVDIVQRTFKEALEHNRPFNEDRRIIRPDGTVRHQNARGFVETDVQGRTIRLYGTVQDITDRKKAEEALRESSQFNQQVIANAREGIIVYDREIRYLVWNPYMEEVTGLRAGEVLGKKPPDLTPMLNNRGRMIVTQEVMNTIYATAKKALTDETFTFYDVPWALKDGSAGWNSVRYGPFRNSEGEIVGVIATVWDITERKRSEEALRESSRFNQQVIDSTREGIIVYDRDLRYMVWNSHMEELTGLKAEILFGRRPAELPELFERHRAKIMIHPKAAEEIEASIKRAMTGETFTFMDVPMTFTQTGKTGWASARYGPFRDSGGEIIGVIAAIRDITDRRESEDALRDSENRFRSLLEQSPVSTQIFSPDGETIRVNRAWEELWGSKWEEIARYNILKDPQLVEKGMMPFILRAFQGEAVTIPAVNYDPAEIGKTGRIRSVRGHIYPVKDGDGHVREVVLMHEDITDRVKAEERVRRQSAALHELHAISTLPELDEQKRCDEVVSALATFFEVPVAAAKRFGENHLDIISLWMRGEIKNNLHMPLLETPSDNVRKAKSSVQIQGPLAEMFPNDPFLGTHSFRSFAGSPIFNNHGEIMGSLNLVHDKPRVYSEDDLQILELFAQLVGAFFERADIEGQLRHSQKLEAIGQLTGGIAHEFNNLLTAIIGNLQLAIRKTGGKEDIQALLSQSDQAAHRAALLTKQLLTFGRKAPVNLSPQNLRMIAEDVVRLLRTTIDRRISVTVDSVEILWPVLADPAQLQQVVMNLCVNARDALMEEIARSDAAEDSLDRPPFIRIKTENVPAKSLVSRPPLRDYIGDCVCLTVMDNGCGMDLEVQGRVFEPFFTTKDVGAGTGLGLATVYGIVEQHNGWIELTSRKNESTTFKVYLPRNELAEQPAPRVDVVSPAPVVGGHETILLVDDEAPIRRLGQTVLVHNGYTVLLANDGTEAAEVFSQRHAEVDLVILDLTMPKRSGWDALRDLRRIDPRVRVIVSSGHRLDQRLKDISAQEQVRFIPKPYRPDDLARIVREVLDQPVD